MYVAQVINGKVDNAFLAPHILDVEAFVSNNDSYIIIDEPLQEYAHYDYVNGEIVLNEEKTNEILIARNKDIIEDMVVKVNKLAFIDSEEMPTMEEIMILFNYVAELKQATTVIPDPPAYVLGLLTEA